MTSSCENEFEKYTCKITSTFPRGQCVERTKHTKLMWIIHGIYFYFKRLLARFVLSAFSAVSSPGGSKTQFSYSITQGLRLIFHWNSIVWATLVYHSFSGIVGMYGILRDNICVPTDIILPAIPVYLHSYLFMLTTNSCVDKGSHAQ